MDFDKCMYPYNDHHKQDTDHIHHSKKFSFTPFQLNALYLLSQATTDVTPITTDGFYLFLDIIYLESYRMTLLYLASLT